MGREGMDRGDKFNISGGSDLIKWSSPIRPAKFRPQSNVNMMIPLKVDEKAAKSEDKGVKVPLSSSSSTILMNPPWNKGVENENLTGQLEFNLEGGEGIQEQEMVIRDDMSEISEDVFRLQEDECMLLKDEEYYASLFFRCDSKGSGKARVSALLQSLRELQALGVENSNADHSFRSVSSSIEDLEGLKSVLDPGEEDPQIDLATFRDGINAYLKIKQWSIISPVKGVQGMMEKAGCGFPRSSSPHRRDLVHAGGRKLFDSNGSQVSGGGHGDCSSLEAFAGSSTNTGSSFEGRDFYAEISDWELKVQKLTKDNFDLKTRLKEAIQENVTLMDSKETQQSEFELNGRVHKARIQRLEGDILQRNGTIASLEDRVTTLNHSQGRLENQLTNLLKENKNLICENADLKEEVKKKDVVLHAKDNVIAKLKAGQGSLCKEWEEKGVFLKEQNELLTRSVSELEVKLQTLEIERGELSNAVKELKCAQEGRSPAIRRITEASFDLDVSACVDDIQTELMNAVNDCHFVSMTQSTPGNSLYLPERFDVAVQCEKAEFVDESVECVLLTENVQPELLHELLNLTRDITEKYSWMLEEYREESAPGDPCPSATGEGNPRVNGSNGAHRKAPADEQNMTSVVREIHEELLDFRNQLKKSQELLNFIVRPYHSVKSSQSLSLTKSCPGLAMDASLNGGDLIRKSISTQTDSPVVETPVLTQKLNLISPILSDSAESHNSFDKLSDDGSVRVRDDLSIVLELSEQETEGNPADHSGDRMSSEMRGNSQGGSRPKLLRSPKAAEDEEQTDKNREREDDYVSVTSSQGESVYLSLERPLKVTISGKGEEDRSSSGAYRSCNSSLILGGSCGRGRIPHADSDTASVASEGNTTFGSPFSSPSSPYWTPSQGSSSQETLTPLDGDRTPVNHEEYDRQTPSGERSGSASFHSPTEIGRIHESKMPTMIRLAFDGPLRHANEDGQLLNMSDWRELRMDVDRRVTEEYNHAFAQEVGNEDAEGAVGLGVEGVVPLPNPQYAFLHDEEAEAYLELMPELAEKLFNCFDVLRDRNESLSPEDLQDLERKFNHMAEVFQTEHTNLEQRISLLTNNLKESQDSLKSMSGSLKSCLITLKEFSRQNGPVEPTEGLLEIVNSLSNMSEEFDLYSTAMCRNARRLGMMDVQNRLHRMMEVMILYVHMLKAKHDQQSDDYRLLNLNYKKATDLLEEHHLKIIPARDSAGGSHPTNNNELKRPLWDGSEMENIEGEKCAEGLSSGFRWILHLLEPKKPNGSQPPPGKLTPKETHSRNPLIRFLTELSLWEMLRWDLFWPWNTEKTLKGLKEAFAVFLMILAMFAIFWRFFPSANAVDPGCYQTSYFKSENNYFSRCGHLNHDEPPII